jgi:hypothetical protein
LEREHTERLRWGVRDPFCGEPRHHRNLPSHEQLPKVRGCSPAKDRDVTEYHRERGYGHGEREQPRKKKAVKR